MFRDDDGNPLPGTVHIPLLDFLPHEAVEKLSPSVIEAASKTAVDISYDDLCEGLADSEKKAWIWGPGWEEWSREHLQPDSDDDIPWTKRETPPPLSDDSD